MTEKKENGYICIHGSKQIEVYADSSYEAQCKAEVEFQKGSRKKIKGYDIITTLCEKEGEQVVHTFA